MIYIFALLLGCILDYIFGDPVKIPHIIVGIGKLIALFEKLLRRILPKTSKGELTGGYLLVVLVLLFSVGPVWGALIVLDNINPFLRLILEALICWQCIAARCLSDAGIGVYKELANHDMRSARQKVGWIVGRDTSTLDENGIIRATVETIAENTSDGVISPLIFMLLGGGVLGVFYKAINTMDSMVGYKNDRYLYFGRAAAKLDDIVNFIPARICGLLMVPAAFFANLDARNALRMFFRDRKNHTSPNSAQTESAAAGALGVQLGGNNMYFGKLVHKPTIGDPSRPLEPEDILSTIRLMYTTFALCLILCLIIGGIFLLWL